MTEELKPCPFCGSDAELVRKGNDYTKSQTAIIRCTKRGCFGEQKVGVITHSYEWATKKVIETWNTRADSAPLPNAVIGWLFSGDTGMSSKALASEYLGAECEYQSFTPLDPADLGRCLRLIKIEPLVRDCVDRLALKHKQWAVAAKCWDEISASMDDEVGIDWSKGQSATKTYDLMKARGM